MFLQQFFNFSQNIYTSISKLYKFLFFYLLVDNQVTELFKNFRNSYFRIELSITQKHPLEVFYVKRCSFTKFFFNKVAGLKPATLLKKRLWHRCFPENCVKFLWAAFLHNTSGRLLLIIASSNHLVCYSKMTFLVPLNEI